MKLVRNGESQDNARELLRPVCTFILEKPLLLEDFPEAVYPLRCLNSSKRQLQKHIQGRLTHVHWGLDKMVFPSMRASICPGRCWTRRLRRILYDWLDAVSLASAWSANNPFRNSHRTAAAPTTNNSSVISSQKANQTWFSW